MSKTITVTVTNEYGKQPLRLLHESGRAVLPTMRESGMELPAFCDGIGKCGRCRIRFEGYAPLPTQTERALLEPEELRNGYRLACMARPIKDCVIECAFVQEQAMDVVTESLVTESPAVESRMPESRMPESRMEKPQYDLQRKEETMIAADIGTTTIAMQLIDRADGRVLETYTCMNPQRSYGTDVISRIKAATDGAGENLRELVSAALQDGIRQLQKGGAKPQLMCIACNTAMGHIFLGYDTSGLGKSPFKPIQLGIVETELEGMRTIVMPGISAFVGGDVVAGLYACGLRDGKMEGCGINSADTEEADTDDTAADDMAAWLFVDLGTNAEMVMGTGERMVCTAAAAGSAFEGMGKDRAMAADRIAGVAQLLKQGLVDETGLLAEPYFSNGIEVKVASAKTSGDKTVFIMQEDIRQLQLAKAAVRTGIHFLMEKLGIKAYSQIQKVWIAGGFGFFLDMEAAGRIGLLPEDVCMRAECAGNTALAGAALAGRRFAAEDVATTTQSRQLEAEGRISVAESFNLAEEIRFEQIYVEFINFPLR